MADAGTAGRTASVLGIALWAPRIPGWDTAAAVLRGDAAVPEQPAARPAPSLLAPTERRRAPDTVAIALEVAARACEAAGLDPAGLASVFASTHGDLAINDYMSGTLARTPTQVSPTRFHNSVHNAAAGYWSIGTGCLRPYTAISAYTDTFGEGLLEALVQAHAGGQPILLVAYDIEARGPLTAMQPSAGIVGAGLVVAPGAATNALATIDWGLGRGSAATMPLERNAGLVAGNAMASCLPLYEALALGGRRTVRVGLAPALMLEMHIDCPVRNGGTLT